MRAPAGLAELLADRGRLAELAAAAALAAALAGVIGLVVWLAREGTETAAPPFVAPPSAPPLPDFAAIADTAERKLRFFDWLEGHVRAENRRLAGLREEAGSYAAVLAAGRPLDAHGALRAQELAERFGVDAAERGRGEVVDELMRRIDGIPVSLVLAQAAIESAWGTSRFVVEGNNVFGQWCFRQGCGMVPRERPAGARHEVRRFDSVAGSVRSYFANINTHPSYRSFRELRAYMRERGQAPDAMVLVLGLSNYSERREEYVEQVRAVIRQNGLLERDRPESEAAPPESLPH